MEERPAVVKLNAAEAGESSGVSVTDAPSAATAAAILRDAGAATAIVTIGLAGAVIVGDDVRALLSPPPIRGRYSVGSGDAFLGGMAVAIARGDSMVEAARLGLAAGIANAQVPGAGTLDPGAIQGILDGIVGTSI
jgi:fructose-1-phosphate kinase PfkB-like protein